MLFHKHSHSHDQYKWSLYSQGSCLTDTYRSPSLTFFTDPENASLISMFLLSSRRCQFYWSCLSLTQNQITVLLILEEMGKKRCCLWHANLLYTFITSHFIPCNFVTCNVSIPKSTELKMAIAHVSIICPVWKHLSSSFFITISWCDAVPQYSVLLQHTGSHFVCIQHGRLSWPAVCGILWLASLFVFLFLCVNKPLFIIKQLMC